MPVKDDLTNVDIAVCVLYMLGGTERLIDEEEVAFSRLSHSVRDSMWQASPHQREDLWPCACRDLLA